MTDELKPVRCGCGGLAEVAYTESGLAYVICLQCLTETRVFRTEAEAITAWNRAMGSPEESSTVERTVKVSEICGEWGKCECGAYVFQPDTEFWKCCPYCGARLEWE